MDKVVRKFSSFAEADRADREYYRSLTPQERLDIALELSDRWRKASGEDPDRLARVYRIVKLPRS